jgi:hypothetical protein
MIILFAARLSTWRTALSKEIKKVQPCKELNLKKQIAKAG